MISKFYNKVNNLKLSLIIKELKIKDKINFNKNITINNISTLDQSKKMILLFFIHQNI